MPSTLRTLEAAELRDLVDGVTAVAAVRRVLVEDRFDPEEDLPRVAADVSSGELLLMPAELGHLVGVKITTVTPGNPAAGLPRIQGLYAVFDRESLSPLALLDAAELTLIRTSAVTAFAVAAILTADPRRSAARIERLVVFGTGPQADRHVRTLAVTAGIGEVGILGRRVDATERLAQELRASGIRATAATRTDLAAADVVICATSSSTPVLMNSEVRDDAVVAAIGAHGLGMREVPPDLVRRSSVVVESVSAAMRESGNLIQARTPREWDQVGVTTLSDLAGGCELPGRGPVLYSSVGMSWEDLTIARAALGA